VGCTTTAPWKFFLSPASIPTGEKNKHSQKPSCKPLKSVLLYPTKDLAKEGACQRFKQSLRDLATPEPLRGFLQIAK